MYIYREQRIPKICFQKIPYKTKKKKESRQESSHPNFPLVYLIFFLLRSIQLSGGFIGSAIFLCLLCDHLNLSVIVQLHLNMPRTPAIYTHRRNSGQPRTCWRASKLEMDIVSNSQKHALLSNEGDQINWGIHHHMYFIYHIYTARELSYSNHLVMS